MNKNKKRMAKGIAAAALIGVIAVGSTLAYLSSVTDTRENKFTSSKDLNGTITETEWDKNHPEGTWEDYLPGDSTGKNPVISIASEGVNGYVAMKVSCKDAAGQDITFENFKTKYADVSYNGVSGINTANWTEDSLNPGFYFYNTSVNAGGATNALFDTVTVNTGIKTVYYTEGLEETQTVKVYKKNPDGSKGDLVSTSIEKAPYVEVSNEELVYIVTNGTEKLVTDADPQLPSFQINVTGYAVQADDNTKDIYKNELRKLAGFTNLEQQ